MRLFLLILGFLAMPSFGLLSLGVKVGAGMATPSYETTVNYNTVNQMGFHGGATFGIDLSDDWEIEAGLLYANRRFGYDIPTLPTVTESLPMLELSALLKTGILPFIDVGAGVYTGVGVGNASLETGGTTTRGSYGAMSRNSSDFGLVATAGLVLPAGPLAWFTLDLSILYGLKDLDSTATGELKMRDVQMLAGIRFGI